MTHFAMSSDTEQMPISLVEAMAACLPVVATDVGDTRAMVCEANRPFIVAPDTEALADALRRLVAQPDLAAEIAASNGAKARVEYGLDTMTGRYDSLFRSMVGQSVRVHQTGT
jgi:glycosyltransferase involved in cell wall biosynthesis